MTNLGTMLTKLGINLDEDISSGYWSTSEKTTYMNMASIMAAGDLLWKLTSTSFPVGGTLIQNKTFYNVPPDLMTPLRLRDTSGVGGMTQAIIPPGHTVELEIEVPSWRVVGSTAPLKHIYRSFDYLQIWPPPNSSYAGATLTLEYVPVPPTLVNNSDVFDGPLGAAEAVIELATVFCLSKYDVEKSFDRYNDKYLPRSQSIRADLNRDTIFKSLKWRVAGRFEKMHHSVGFHRIFPFGIHY